MAEWNEDLHPRDHGKFSTSEGEHGGVTDEHRERGRASLADPAFRQEHALRLATAAGNARKEVQHTEAERGLIRQNIDRIQAAADKVRDAAPREERGGNVVHEAAQRAIDAEVSAIHAEHGVTEESAAARNAALEHHETEEAARIHAEHEAIGGDKELHDLAMETRNLQLHSYNASLADQHTAAMAAVNNVKQNRERERVERETEDRALAAGHVSGEVRDMVGKLQEHERAGDEHIDRLIAAHQEAAAALGALHAHAHEGDEELGIKPMELGHEHGSETSSLIGAMQYTADSLTDGEHGEHGEHDYENEHHEPAFDEARDHSDVAPEHAPHPDSEDHEWMNLHPDHKDFEFDNPHPDHREYEFENPHPDSPHLSAGERPETPEEHANMLAAHNEERAQAIAAHDAERAAALADHEAERQPLLADHEEYKTKMTAFAAEASRHAEVAQAALEKLHEHQLAAHAGLKVAHAEGQKLHGQAEKKLEQMDEHSLVNHEAFAHHARDYGGDENGRAYTIADHKDDYEHPEYATEFIADKQARQQYDDAHAASESMHQRASEYISEHGPRDYGDALNNLKAEMKTTVSAIKELSKHTGRAPRIPQKTKKAAGKRRRRRIYTSPDRGAAVMMAGY